MGEPEIEVVRDQYDAVNRRDWERAMSHYAEDVELVIPDEMEIRVGTFTGLEAVRTWFSDWFSSFDRDLHFEIEEIRRLEDGSVYVAAVNRAHGKLSGIEVTMTVFWHYEFRDRHITRLKQFRSRDDAVRELGGRGLT